MQNATENVIFVLNDLFVPLLMNNIFVYSSDEYNELVGAKAPGAVL
jgi:hypothetical protein